MIFDPCCASASLRFTVSRMTVSSPIIPCGPSSSTRAPFDYRSTSIPQPYLKSFLTAAAGGTRGGTASTIMSITIRPSTRFWASLVAALGSVRRSERARAQRQGRRCSNPPGGYRPSTSQSEQRFSCRRAYAPSGAYDECTSLDDRAKALPAIPRAARPHKDPVYGKNGPLMLV
jgi:hypothetical protein